MTSSPAYTSIVVGTDGSSTANTAVGHAIDLASRSGAKLNIVCASTPVGPAQGPTGQPAGGPSPADAATAVLNEMARMATAAGIEHVDTYVRQGDPADAIISVAEDESADLIIVGNKGMAGARRFLLGSVPDKVSHHAPCSVLIVRTS